MDHWGRRARGPLAWRSRLRRQRRRRLTRAPTPARRPRRKRSRAASSRSCGPVMSTTSTAARPTTRWAISSATRRRSTLYSYKPDDARDDGAGPGRGRSAGLRGRQDRHGQDQAGRQVLAAVQTTKSTSEDVKYAIERGFFTSVATGFTRRTSRTSRAPRSASRPAPKIEGIETPDDHDARAQVQAPGRRRDGRRRAGLPARPRRCRRSTPRSSTPRRRRPTARTSSRPART